MIGLVVVSHSATLAQGACELAAQVAQGRVNVAPAGGSSDPSNPLGTDAFKVLDAIRSVYSGDGVIVLMDLGSAVLSAETALDLLDDAQRANVRLSAAPLVEGAVAAASQAAAGATLDEILREAGAALAAKQGQLGFAPAAPEPPPPPQTHSVDVTVPNRLGLHARPAARLIRLARGFDARITVENLTRRSARVDARSLSGVLLLGARRHDLLRFQAHGPDAPRALRELAAFIESGCGDTDAADVAPPAHALPGPIAGIPASIAIEPLGERQPAIPQTPSDAAAPAAPDHALPGPIAGIPASSGIAIEPLGECQPAVPQTPSDAAAPDHALPGRITGIPASSGIAIEPLGERQPAVSQIPSGDAAAPAHAPPGRITGIPASSGIAIGPLRKLQPAVPQVSIEAAADPDAEQQRLLAALNRARDEMRGLRETSAIFDAQMLLLEDPALIEHASSLIKNHRLTAAAAWQTAAASAARALAELPDSYLQLRAADIADVAARVFRRLGVLPASHPELAEPSILAAHDLTASELAELDRRMVLGLCLEAGGTSAHSLILARAMGIPAVVGIGPALAGVDDGTTLAVDGDAGIVYPNPDAALQQALRIRRDAWLAARQTSAAARRAPARTRDGAPVKVFANISGVAEAAGAVEYGADGVGVLRTEFLFLDRKTPPTEDEQFAAYRAIAETLAPRPVVIRTLDAGGDKALPYLDLPGEANPFLGLRGVRLTLARPDLFRTQLRAILRAAHNLPVELLLPMVSTLSELREAKTVLAEVEAALTRESAPFARNIKVGVMIEVPSAVAIADQLAPECAAFSIGTNDLTQYVMAADRTSAQVSAVADHYQPAVLRMIRQTADAGRAHGVEVVLCGEMAASPAAAPLLLGLGIREFSVSPPFIPELKQVIARCALEEAESLARQALAAESAAAVRRLLAAQQSPPRP